MHPRVLHHMVISSHQPYADLHLSVEAERWRSPAAGSGSDVGAEASGSQVQCFDTYGGPLLRIPRGMLALG
jgi:hypothetical protein